MIWQLRFARNLACALAPFPRTLKRLKRSVSPRAAALDAWTVEQALRQVVMIVESGGAVRDARVLVIGNMSQPVLALVFALAGARSVLMVDRGRALERAALADTAERLADHAALLSTRLGRDAAGVRAALAPPRGATLGALLAHFRLEHLAGGDPAATGLAAHAVDVVASRAALEHLRPATVARVFAESRRVLAPGGRVCHVIDNSDHWSHGDPDISAVHFLRYPEWLWPLFVLDAAGYQNRLRHPDYLRMLRHAGFRVVLDPSVPDPVAVSDVRAMRVARRFRRFAPGQLGVITSYLVAVPAG